MQTCKIIYPGDLLEIKILKILFYSSGLYYLFASFHLRDAIIVLIYTLQMYYFANFIKSPVRFYRLFNFVCLNIFLSVVYFYLRLEFVMIPIIFVIIYSLFQFIESKRLKLNIVTIFSFFIIFCSFLIIVINIDSIIYVCITET